MHRSAPRVKDHQLNPALSPPQDLVYDAGSMKSPALPVLALLCLLASATPSAQADESRLRELITRLDAEDPVDRDEATAKLAAAGEEAWPLLEEAARDGSPEVRSRAETLLTPLKIRRILDRPSPRAPVLFD